jgi:glycosyltransferase involved in cell wall biosynthesis
MLDVRKVMRILYVLSEPCYPAVNGARIPPYHSVRLMSRDNELMLASLVSPECEPYDLKPLEELCEKVVTVKFPRIHPALVACKALLRREIYYMERFRSEEFRAQLMEMIAEFKPDVVHFDFIVTTQYIDCVPPGIGTVASINDSFTFSMENTFKQKRENSLFMKLYRHLQYYQVRYFEKTFYPKFDIVHTMTENDAGFLRCLNPNIRTEAIPNGTSVEELGRIDHKLPPDHVIFVGRLSRDINLQPLTDFLNIAWSKIRRVKPQAVFHIVGRKMAGMEPVIKIAEQLGGVQFEGFIENLADVYSKAGIAIVPINKNCGIVNKAIEAMAAGLCVVGFHKTFEGIPEAKNGENSLAVESFEEMGDIILDMMDNEEKQRAIQKSARETAMQCFGWESRRIRYQRMYERAANLAKSSF